MRPLLTLCLVIIASPGMAQTDSTSRTPARLCWRGKPAPQCTVFWITEFGVDFSTSSTQRVVSENFGGGDVYRYAVRDFDSRLTWTVGPMFNRGTRKALGATVSISPLSEHYRAALEARRRWWAGDDLALDLSAGALKMGVESRTSPSYRDEYGLTAGGFIVGADLINVNGRVDVLLSGGRPRLGTSIGLGGGSSVALIGSIALGLLVLALLSAGPWD